MKVVTIALAVIVLVLAGCGGSKAPPTTTTPAPPDPAGAMRALIATEPSLAGTVRTLFTGSEWAVVQSTSLGHAKAVAFHLVGGSWHADRSGNVKIEILGPQPGAVVARTPQVAIQFSAKDTFVETALWVDGTELLEKGGGSPTRGTIYGAPGKPLAPGSHVAVGYARAGTSGTAVAWVFSVR